MTIKSLPAGQETVSIERIVQAQHSLWKKKAPVLKGLLVIILASGVFFGCSKRPSAKPDPLVAKTEIPIPKRDRLKSLQPEISQAWRKAGAIEKLFGSPDYVELDPNLPVFVFLSWEDDLAANLPPPQTPFGLNLAFTKVTDRGIKRLAEMDNLRLMDLGGTKVTNISLKELGKLKNLQLLNLGSTQITEEGLKDLSKLNNLLGLELANIKVTDAGIKQLVGLKNLQALNLINTKVTDAGLKELAKLDLEFLLLSKTEVSDRGLKELAGLKNMKALYLSHTRVTDAGLNELARMKKLRRLDLSGTNVSLAGERKLQKELPGCSIQR